LGTHTLKKQHYMENLTQAFIKTYALNLFGSEIHTKYGGKSERTKILRSITPLGFAKAFFEANP